MNDLRSLIVVCLVLVAVLLLLRFRVQNLTEKAAS